MMKRILFALAFTIFSHQALAIVSMQDVHLNPPGEGLGGRLAFNLNTLAGNSVKQDYDIGGGLSYKHGKSTSILLANYAYGESGTPAVPYTDRDFMHLREIYQTTQGFAWEALVQRERNKIARLYLRQLYGGGARFTFTPGDNSVIYLGLGLFNEAETLDNTPGTSDGGYSDRIRENLYLVLKYTLNDSIKLINSTYLQPALSDSADWRMLEALSLQLSLSKTLAWKTSWNYRYDNQPPQTIGPIDSSFSSSLEYRF